MATSIALHPPAFMDGIAVAAQDLRLQATSAFLTGASPSGTTGIAARPGVRYGTGNPLQVTPSSGMTISVGAGIAFVQGSASATAGMYVGCLDTAGTLTLTTSDPTNPRIDNVIVQFVDNGNNTSTGAVTFQTGTPAPSPTAQTLPANSLLLAQIAVAASASSISSGNITDSRVYTAATGGIVPMANTSGGITGPAGLYVHDLSSGRMKVSDGSGNAVSPKIAPWASTSSTVASFVTSTSTFGAATSVTVTVDGSTEINIFASWPQITPTGTASVGDTIGLQITWNGFGVGQVNYVRVESTGSQAFGGGNIQAWLTPAAGTHTLALVAGSNGHTYTVANPYIRVAASNQR